MMALGLAVSDKKFFKFSSQKSIFIFMFSYLAYVNLVTPVVGHFWPQGHN